MNGTFPDRSTSTTADPAVAASNLAGPPPDKTRRKRWGVAVRRIAAAVSAAHTARVPF